VYNKVIIVAAAAWAKLYTTDDAGWLLQWEVLVTSVMPTAMHM